MARFKATVESASGLAANTTFANLVAESANNFKLRRLTLGCRATTAVVPTSQQVTVAIYRATVRGTASTTVTGIAMDPRSVADPSTGLDTAWSGAPTLAASREATISFNTQATVDLYWEGIEELICDLGTANGLALENIQDALPTGHVLTADLEWEV